MPDPQRQFFNPSGSVFNTREGGSFKYSSPFQGTTETRSKAVGDLTGLSPEQIDVVVNQRLDEEKRKLDAEIQKSRAALTNLEGPSGDPKQAAQLRAHLDGLLSRRGKIDQEAEIIKTQAKQPYEARRAAERREREEGATEAAALGEKFRTEVDDTEFRAGQERLSGVADKLGRQSDLLLSDVDRARQDQQIFRDQALGRGPSAAQGVLRQGTDEAIRAGMALASSGRGANQAGALRAAGLQGQTLSGQAATQATILAAQEQQQGMQNLLQSQAQIQQGVAAASQITANQAQVVQGIVQNEQQQQAFLAGLDQQAKAMGIQVWMAGMQQQLAEKGIEVDLSALNLQYEQFDFEKKAFTFNTILGAVGAAAETGGNIASAGMMSGKG